MGEIITGDLAISLNKSYYAGVDASYNDLTRLTQEKDDDHNEAWYRGFDDYYYDGDVPTNVYYL